MDRAESSGSGQGYAGQAVRLLFCYLREKWTTLVISNGSSHAVGAMDARRYTCMDSDEECVLRRCCLASETLRDDRAARDPWFEE